VRDAARVDAARETTRANNALLFAFMQDSSAHAARHYMQRVFARAHTIRPRHAALLAAIDTREKHNAAKPVAFPRALAVNESKVDETPIHDRGDHMQPTGDTIARAIPAILERSLAGPAFPKGSNSRNGSLTPIIRSPHASRSIACGHGILASVSSIRQATSERSAESQRIQNSSTFSHGVSRAMAGA
jgi:hypothetical protein